MNYGGEWKNSDANFDNVINAITTLFEIMTTEGWLDVMCNGIDSRGIEKQPKYNYKVYISLYFISFVLLGAMIISNLFTATIVDHFNQVKEREEVGYGVIVTKSQKQWIEIQAVCLRNNLIFKPRPPKNKLRKI